MEIKRNIDRPRELSTVNVHQLNLWISIQDTQSNLHYDAYHNVLIVLHGILTVKCFQYAKKNE